MAGDDVFSEEDIRPPDLMKNLSAVPGIGHKRDVLLSKSAGFVTIACPACGGHEHRAEFVKMGFSYVGCADCGLVFNNPRPDQAMLADYYADNPLYKFWNEEIFKKTEAARQAKITVPRVDRVIELCRANRIHGGTLLEIGAGFGTFGVEIKSRGMFRRIIAVEPTEALAATCLKRGLETMATSYEDLNPDQIQADAVVSFEVIEHLFAPDDFIDFCARALRVGGLLVLSFPNMDGFDTMLLREKSGSVGGEHINMFNAGSISTLLQRKGFRVVDLATPGHLDAELVRKAVLNGDYELTDQPWLQRVLVTDWESLGRPFQEFLHLNGMSSHMVVAAVKGDEK